MTYGDYGPGPTGPQYPYAPGPYYGYGPDLYGPPPGPGGYPPPPPQEYPPTEPNVLATLSVVFAFVCAPIGALLGHLALGQIRRNFQRGRDRAVIGLTLSYTFIVLGVLGLVAMAVIAHNAPSTSSVAVTAPDVISPAPSWTTTPNAAPAPDLSKVLLSLDEVKAIMKTPGLDELPSSTSGGSGGKEGDARADPPECAGAVAPGLNTVYDESGATAYERTSFSDPGTATMVEQVAASFDNAAAARAFVAQNAEQWRRCGGKRFTITASSGSLAWEIGNVVVTGDRASLQNTLTAKQDLPQYRIMAAKGNVVIDLGVLSKQTTTATDTIADRILARIPA